jgi:hypothetical protein
MRYITGFVRFWYDFIVGDSWLLAACGGLVLGLVWLLTDVGADHVAEVAVPLTVIGGIAVSLPRKR